MVKPLLCNDHEQIVEAREGTKLFPRAISGKIRTISHASCRHGRGRGPFGSVHLVAILIAVVLHAQGVPAFVRIWSPPASQRWHGHSGLSKRLFTRGQLLGFGIAAAKGDRDNWQSILSGNNRSTASGSGFNQVPASSETDSSIFSWLGRSVGRSARVRAGSRAKMGATNSPEAAAGTSIRPAWMLVQSQLQSTLDDYLKQVDKEAARLLLLTAREQRMIPKQIRDAREKVHEESKAANIALVNALKQALPEKFASKAVDPPPDAVLRIVHHDGAKLGTQNYASLGSILLHLLRDWSAECQHVIATVYAPIVAQLKARLPARKTESAGSEAAQAEGGAQCAEAGPSPGAPSVLVPGSGLSRLAYELMKQGYDVECNEFSPAFATVANYIFNECDTRHAAFPLAHVFGENYGLSNQYLRIETPSVLPARERGAGESMVMTTGDFVYLYKAGGPAHRKFDCVATCFFIDTCDDLLDYVETIDGVLKDGGIWINLGPLNYKKDLKLKLAWEELQAVWEGMGYEFVHSSRVYTPYHLPAGLKLYTEQYDAVFTTAIKRPRPSA